MGRRKVRFGSEIAPLRTASVFSFMPFVHHDEGEGSDSESQGLNSGYSEFGMTNVT